MDLNYFFTRERENEMNADFISTHYAYDFSSVEEYLLTLIASPFQEYLDFVKKDPLSPVVLSSDVPQFSNIDSAVFKITDLLSTHELRGYRFEEVGKMLQPEKTEDVVANKKYGENHVKTATDLGLCFILDGRYYISPIGITFSRLSSYQRDQLLARFALRNNLVYTVIHKSLNGQKVCIADEISFLSESTVKRRKNNCLIMCRLIQRNRDLPVEDILSKIE